MAEYVVAGRRFRTEADYEAAVRDQNIIEEIKKTTDLRHPGQVIRLYSEMQSGKYRFESVIGNDFDDEIYELAMQYKKQGFTGDSTKPHTDKRTFGRKRLANYAPRQKSSAHAGKTDYIKQNTSEAQSEDMDASMKKAVLLEMKKRESRRRVLSVLCTLVAVSCLGYFVIYSFYAERTEQSFSRLAELKDNRTPENPDKMRIAQSSSGKDKELTVLDEYETLYNKNKSLIGWLKIDDTNIDYPVMQTVNNEYYLDHNFEQEYDRNGSLFLDAGCDIVDRSTNLIIYGHRMSSGKMFGTLNQYSSKSFYEKHPEIQFDTIYDKGKYEVMYVFRSHIYNEDEIVFKYYQFIDAVSEKEFNSNMQEMAALSLYDTGVTAEFGDELLTLSTCDYTEQDGRFVVVAKKVL